MKLDKEAPLTCGLEDITLQSEQYYIHVDPAVQVWATTKFPVFPGPHDANGEIDLPVVYTKFWGKGSTRFSYALNYGWVKSTQTEIRDGDQLTAYFGQATDYSDLLTWFDRDSYQTEVGTEKEFSVNGISIYKSGETGDGRRAPEKQRRHQPGRDRLQNIPGQHRHAGAKAEAAHRLGHPRIARADLKDRDAAAASREGGAQKTAAAVADRQADQRPSHDCFRVSFMLPTR